MKYLVLIFTVFSLSIHAQDYQEFEISDGKIAYKKFGNGYPVLIINGGPGMNSKGFAPLAEMLSENNTTIIYDQRGTGKSELNELNSSNISIDLMVEDIEKLREELGYEQWIVLGHSFGGMLAYAYDAKYLYKITAMIKSHCGGLDLDILNGPSTTSRLSDIERDSLAYYSIKIREGDNSYKTAMKRAEFLSAAYLYDKSLVPKIAERFTQGNMMLNSWVWNDLQRIRFDMSAEMRSFEKPVLILNGADEAAPVSLAEKAHEIFPNSKLVIMPECGHYGWLERPDIYLKEVKSFLKTNSSFVN